MPIHEILASQVSRGKHTYRAQVVKAVRIWHELAGSATDHVELCTTLDALEAAIDAAVKAEGQRTVDIFREFVNCLNDEEMSRRMEDARKKDQQKPTRAAPQSARLERIMEKVKNSPVLSSEHIIVVAEPRIDIRLEIPHGAKLPAILWKFYRICGTNALIRNPHFYADTPFKETVVKEVLPLHDRNDGKWTKRIFVYGDSKEGPIRLTSQDETISRLFGAVTQCLARFRPLTVFKEINGRLLAEEEVELIFSSARDLKCFRWRDSSFVLDPDVRTVQDIVKSSKRRTVPSFPMGPSQAQNAQAASSSSVDPFLRPSHPPPTTQGPPRNQDPSLFAKSEAAKVQAVQYDGTPGSHHDQGQSRLPLLVPAQPLLEDESIFSSLPASSSPWFAGSGTPELPVPSPLPLEPTDLPQEPWHPMSGAGISMAEIPFYKFNTESTLSLTTMPSSFMSTEGDETPSIPSTPSTPSSMDMGTT